MSVAGLSDPPRPEPAGTPIYELGGKVIGDALRAASREFEREIKSVGGSLSDPPPLGSLNEPWQPDPTGTSVKSLETPGYLRDSPPEEPPPI